MYRKMNKNRGFTLIELLISMALLSIIMVMVVQFMSSTAGANKKTQYNLKVQNTANEVMSSITESLMRASFIKVVPVDTNYYAVSKSTTDSDPAGAVSTANRKESIDTAMTGVPVELPAGCQLVPDDYGNYVNPNKKVERKVIVNLEDYSLPGEKKKTFYPLTNDLEANTIDGVTIAPRSFRILKQEIGGNDTYLYVKPEYIYVEYKQDNELYSVIYHFVYKSSKLTNIYMHRSSETLPETSETPDPSGTPDPSETPDPSGTSTPSETPNRYATAKSAVDSLSGQEGMLTEFAKDFYLSADVEGNALLIDALFDVNGYLYNAAETTKFRNSQVLTVRPQNLYKMLQTSEEDSSSESPGGEGSSDEGTGGGVVQPPVTP